MPTQFRRRSDRVSLAVPIQVEGTDAAGQSFHDETRTLTISRQGAKIFMVRALVPEQQITIRCLGTGREAQARVVWQSEAPAEGYFYGVEIPDPAVNLWGIDFPPPTESEIAAGRVLLECASCHTFEVAYLNSLELELFQINQRVSWPCKRCDDMTIWSKPSLQELLSGPGPAPLNSQAGIPELAAVPPARTENERDEPRLGLKVTGCVQTGYYGEDVVETENVSDSGFCFKSLNQYAPGTMIEVAIPYVQRGGNVFVPAQIIWARERQVGRVTYYGGSYFHARRRAKRVKATKVISVGIIGAGVRLTGSILDLSMTGILVRCSEQVKEGTPVRMGIEAGQETIRMAAVARRWVPGIATAFEFTQMAQRDRALLRRLILRLGRFSVL